jgi:hypothetical protein
MNLKHEFLLIFVTGGCNSLYNKFVSGQDLIRENRMTHSLKFYIKTVKKTWRINKR